MKEFSQYFDEALSSENAPQFGRTPSFSMGFILTHDSITPTDWSGKKASDKYLNFLDRTPKNQISPNLFYHPNAQKAYAKFDNHLTDNTSLHDDDTSPRNNFKPINFIPAPPKVKTRIFRQAKIAYGNLNADATSDCTQATNYDTQATNYDIGASNLDNDSTNYISQTVDYNTQATNYNAKAVNYDNYATNHDADAVDYTKAINYDSENKSQHPLDHMTYPDGDSTSNALFTIDQIYIEQTNKDQAEQRNKGLDQYRREAERDSFIQESLSQVPQEILKWLKEATEGDAEAMHNLALCFAEGAGLEVDMKKAAAWWEKSALAGFTPSLYNIAQCYEFGRGVEKDTIKAMYWWQKSAELGNSNAQFNLATHLTQQSAAQDLPEAFKWYEKAARQGHFNALLAIARIYALGIATPKSKEKSTICLLVASKLNPAHGKEAQVIAENMLLSMSDTKKAEVYDLATELFEEIRPNISVEDV